MTRIEGLRKLAERGLEVAENNLAAATRGKSEMRFYFLAERDTMRRMLAIMKDAADCDLREREEAEALLEVYRSLMVDPGRIDREETEEVTPVVAEDCARCNIGPDPCETCYKDKWEQGR